MRTHTLLSYKRLIALCRKEAFQIIRDPSSILIALFFPLLLLVIFGYGINFDSKGLHIGIVLEDQSLEARRFSEVFSASPYLQITIGTNTKQLTPAIQKGKIRGIVVIPQDFTRRLHSGEGIVPIQVITDGSEPNTAKFVQSFVQGVWRVWLEQRTQDTRSQLLQTQHIDLIARYWFNAEATSQNFIIPGAIAIIITVVGAVLTSLVIAREWERGTMEAMLATRITKAELLLSKFIPYYLLGLFALAVCMAFSKIILEIPFRGSWILLFLTSSLFLCNALGIGLLISTATKNQFNAAQIALNTSFLPSIMLSGFIYEVSSMPGIIQAVSYLLPARYYVAILKTLFLSGNIGRLLIINSAFLFITGLFFISLTYIKTPTRLK